MRSGLLLFLLSSAFSESPDLASQTNEGIIPRVELDIGIKLIRFWHEQQKKKVTPYDGDSCYGWIGMDWPKTGQYIGIGFTPNCKIVKGELYKFSALFQEANSAYHRYSDDPYIRRNRCTHNHLFITRLHRLDEGGLFTYHYTRVRLLGNRIQVTLFALKDVVDVGKYYHSISPAYEHPSVKFYNAEPFPISYEPFVTYSIDNEIHVWFRSREGLRLINYRLTWDATNTDNGYHVDVFQESAIPNAILSEERVAYVLTSDQQMHYFLVKTDVDNEHNIFVLAHNDLMAHDFSRIQTIEMKMPVDIYPRAIIGELITFYSRGVEDSAVRYNRMCIKRNHVNIYANKTMPLVTDPPLSLNIFATHYRSAYPFVTNGRRVSQPSYFRLIVPILLTVAAILASSWVVIGYDMLPQSIARWIRLKMAAKRHYWFKSLAKNKDSQFAPLFRFLFRVERIICGTGRMLCRAVRAIKWMGRIETTDEGEEIRLLLPGPQVQPPSTREHSS